MIPVSEPSCACCQRASYKESNNQGIERGGRNTVVNFLSPSAGIADKFREYLIVEVDDLRPEQGFAMSSP
ncbi:MAG TPA: hypothetical protein VFS97_09245, partial [Nitrososphaeraceae archaeon]|nr:hypothetical protein [Nitrososphaeraceae archaeon]